MIKETSTPKSKIKINKLQSKRQSNKTNID